MTTRHHGIQWISAIVLYWLCSTAVALAPAEPSTKGAIDQLMQLSGITDQVGIFPEHIKAGLHQGAQQGTPLSAAQLDVLSNSVDKSIDTDVILRSIRSALSTSVGEKDIDALMGWYQSPLGKKISALEKQSSTPEASQEMMSQMQALLQNETRVAAAKRIDQALGVTDKMVELQRFTGLAVYTAMMTALAPGQPLDTTLFEANMVVAEQQMRASMEQMVAASYVYTYQTISDQELAEYETFISGPAAKKFNVAALDGMARGFETVVVTWSQALANLFLQQDDGVFN